MSNKLYPTEARAWELIQEGKSVNEVAIVMDIKRKYAAMLVSQAKTKLGIPKRPYHREETRKRTYCKEDQGERDIDDSLDDVDAGLRCRGCHLLFTPRSTCTPSHCDARDDPFNNDIPKIRAMMESMNDLDRS